MCPFCPGTSPWACIWSLCIMRRGRVGTWRLLLNHPYSLIPPLGLGINSLCSVLCHVLQLLSSCTLVLGWEVNRKGSGSCKLKAGGCKLRCLVSKTFLVLHFKTFISFFQRATLFEFLFPSFRKKFLKNINGKIMSSFFNLCSALAVGACSKPCPIWGWYWVSCPLSIFLQLFQSNLCPTLHILFIF